MKRRTSIGISLHAANQIIDLQIPTQISIARLKELLIESLGLLPVKIPESFELVVLNKPIHLAENHLLADYPIGDGDQLCIKESTGEAIV